MNGERRELPVEDRETGIRIFISGRFAQVTTGRCDIKLAFDGKSKVILSVPKKYGQHLEGLCGDCNGQKDDYRTREGVDVSGSKDRFSLIGNSYSVADASDTPETRCVLNVKGILRYLFNFHYLKHILGDIK